MSEFMLEILTPEKEFFSGKAESVTCTLADGEMTVLRGHHPMLAALEIGKIKLRTGGKQKTAFSAEGFIEVRPDEVLIFTQLCEWPEDIDENRAEQETAEDAITEEELQQLTKLQNKLFRQLKGITVPE